MIDVVRRRTVEVLTRGDIGSLTWASEDRLIEAGSEIRVLEVPGGRLAARERGRFPRDDGRRRSRGTGLLAFDAAGGRAFQRFRGRDVAILGDHGRYAYVWVRRARMLHVIELSRGRTVRRIPTLPRACRL